MAVACCCYSLVSSPLRPKPESWTAGNSYQSSLSSAIPLVAGQVDLLTCYAHQRFASFAKRGDTTFVPGFHAKQPSMSCAPITCQEQNGKPSHFHCPFIRIGELHSCDTRHTSTLDSRRRMKLFPMSSPPGWSADKRDPFNMVSICFGRISWWWQVCNS